MRGPQFFDAPLIAGNTQVFCVALLREAERQVGTAYADFHEDGVLGPKRARLHQYLRVGRKGWGVQGSEVKGGDAGTRISDFGFWSAI
jgi:hypothetical protein